MKNPFISDETRATSSVLFDEPGPIAQRRIRIFNIAAVVLFALFAVYVLTVMGQKGQLEAEKWTDLFTARAWSSYYLPGLASTLSAAAVSVVTSVAFGDLLLALFGQVQRSSACSATFHRRGCWSDPVQRFGDR